METINVVSYSDIPRNFTGKVILRLIGSTDIFYFKGGVHHRIDGGPALEYQEGTKMWKRDGYYHRTDGPAIIWSDGIREWWIEDEIFFSVDEWFNAITSEQKENALWNEDLWK